MPAALDALDALLALFDLERIEENIYRGENRNIGSRRVFGGQVLAQALTAAARTVEAERIAHSVHAYFILPGDLGAPIVYDVDRIRDGGSFTTRRVRAIQHGRPIFNLSASFHRDEAGPEHQAEPGAGGGPEGVPGPDGLPSEIELLHAIAHLIPEPLRAVLTQERPFEFRPTDPVNPFAPEPKAPQHAYWLRARGELPDVPAMHRACLAYVSDHGLLPVALRPHAFSWLEPDVQVTSLDHALWFHRPFRVDRWLLYTMESPTAAGARGFVRGSVYQEGRLVASVAQEGLMRQRKA